MGDHLPHSDAKYLGLRRINMNFSQSYSNISTQAINITSSPPHQNINVDITWFITAILTLSTNLSVLLIILCRRHLRILSNATICSMFICGSAYSLLYLFPSRVLVHWLPRDSFLHFMMPSIGIAFIICHNLHLSVICMQKISSIISPFRHRQLLRQKNVVIVISLVWVIPFISSLTLLVLDTLYLRSNYTLFPNYVFTRHVLYTLMFVVIVIIPIILTIILYIVALIKVNRRNRIRSLDVNYTHCQTRQIYGGGQNVKIILQMLTMLGLFTICWLPSFILYIAITYNGAFQLLEILRMIFYLGCSYPAVNPILLAYYTNSIRKEIKGLIYSYFSPSTQNHSIKQSTANHS